MLWLQRIGDPDRGGWNMVMRRVEVKSGVPRVHFQLFRHTFGSTAITPRAAAPS